MDDILAENVTLFDLVSTGRLSNPPRYLRLALANMLRAGEWGTVTLRIGRTGNGTWPMYILERGAVILDHFGGQSHERWVPAFHDDANWSKKAITGPDLHDLWRGGSL